MRPIRTLICFLVVLSFSTVQALPRDTLIMSNEILETDSDEVIEKKIRANKPLNTGQKIGLGIAIGFFTVVTIGTLVILNSLNNLDMNIGMR